VREALTLEVFLALNEAFRALEAYERKGMPDLPAFRDALSATHKGIFTVVGAIDHTSTRDEGWRFLKLGESLERSYRSALVLHTKLPALLAAEARGDAPLYYTQWRTLLRGLSSLENYRRVYGARLEPNLLGLLRLRHIPCRYVSGYLHVERKEREPSQSHAWVELHSSTAGWVAFDPTHNRAVDERYVVVGHGRHYDDVPPNKGIYWGIAKETLKAEVVTEVIAGKFVSTLREEIRHIDLPVFREIPVHPPDRIVTGGAEVGAQQQ
jgi:hypothetical protein